MLPSPQELFQQNNSGIGVSDNLSVLHNYRAPEKPAQKADPTERQKDKN